MQIDEKKLSRYIRRGTWVSIVGLIVNAILYLIVLFLIFGSSMGSPLSLPSIAKLFWW